MSIGVHVGTLPGCRTIPTPGHLNLYFFAVSHVESCCSFGNPMFKENHCLQPPTSHPLSVQIRWGKPTYEVARLCSGRVSRTATLHLLPTGTKRCKGPSASMLFSIVFLLKGACASCVALRSCGGLYLPTNGHAMCSGGVLYATAFVFWQQA